MYDYIPFASYLRSNVLVSHKGHMRSVLLLLLLVRITRVPCQRHGRSSISSRSPYICGICPYRPRRATLFLSPEPHWRRDGLFQWEKWREVRSRLHRHRPSRYRCTAGSRHLFAIGPGGIVENQVWVNFQVVNLVINFMKAENRQTYHASHV